MRFSGRHSVLIGAMSGGIAAVVLQKRTQFPISPLKAALCGMALGVIVVQLKWIRDLLRPGSRHPGSLAYPIDPVFYTEMPGTRRTAAAMVAMGLLCFPLHRFLVSSLDRDVDLLIFLGPVLAILGLAALWNPRLLAARPRKKDEVWNPRPQERVVFMLSMVGLAIGVGIWVAMS